MALLVQLSIIATVLALPSFAWSQTLGWDFHSLEDWNAVESTGIWNPIEGQIQAPLATNGNPSRVLSFGDGSDGNFEDGPSQTGITDNDTEIIFDTDIKAIYQFQNFTLTSGHIIQVIGSQPLQIKVLGDVRVDGVIRLDGDSGDPHDATTPASGGISHGGNGHGGAGASGSPAIAAEAGLPNPTPHPSPDPLSPQGGGPGQSGLSTLYEGGGGGCNGGGGIDATSGSTLSGATVTNAATCDSRTYSEAAEYLDTVFSGGGGGGGGGAMTAAPVQGGAGGGGGGGALKITALGTIEITGTLSANGGDGGRADTSLNGGVDCGGSGGGGSGGTIWLQAGKTFSGSGTLSVQKGLGGQSNECGPSYQGGDGSKGIIRMEKPSTGGFGTFMMQPSGPDLPYPLEAPASATYQIVSAPLDLNGRSLALKSPEEETGCGGDGSLTVFYEGSHDAITYSQGVQAAEITSLQKYRYIRFRTEIEATGSNPPCLTGLTIPYDLAVISDFEMKGGMFCGRTQQHSSVSHRSTSGDWPVFFGLTSFAWWLSRRRTKPKVGLAH